MTPQPWSWSSLQRFTTCPAQFYGVNVLKAFPDTSSEASVWGQQVHGHFEARVGTGTPLPPALVSHEGYLAGLASSSGAIACEQRVALNTRLECSGFFSADVWVRGIIDYLRIDGPTAWVVDYKTGKVKPSTKQTALFGLFVLHTHPQVDTVRTSYYWTTTHEETPGAVVTREGIPEAWGLFTPDLRQYMQAFHDDVWQRRPSGLCYGWCPVTDCENWRPKRRK